MSSAFTKKHSFFDDLCRKYEYQEALEKRVNALLEKEIKPVIYLEAGHFDPRKGADVFAQESLKEAIHIGEQLIHLYKNKIRLVFGILINDLALQCGNDGGSCSIAAINPEPMPTDIPDSLENIFAQSRIIKRDKILLFYERTSKNRAVRSLKPLIKSADPNLIIDNDILQTSLYFEDQEGQKIHLATKENHIFRIKCPAIMGQHYKDVYFKIHQRFLDLQHLIIMDWASMIDYNKVTAGSQAFLKIFSDRDTQHKCTIFNTFFQDPEGKFTTFEQFYSN